MKRERKRKRDIQNILLENISPLTPSNLFFTSSSSASTAIDSSVAASPPLSASLIAFTRDVTAPEVEGAVLVLLLLSEVVPRLFCWRAAEAAAMEEVADGGILGSWGGWGLVGEAVGYVGGCSCGFERL